MTTFKKLLLASAFAGSSMFAAGAASAQVAVADPDGAVENSKVWAAAQAEIATTYKTQIDAARVRSEAISKELAPLYKQFDTNGDNQLSQAEIASARATKGAAFAQVEAREKTANEELGRMTLQPTRARLYAAEQIGAKVSEAVSNVVKARKITLLVRPNAAFFADPSADITPAISAEIDRLLPRASTTPPAGWQPGQNGAAAAGTRAPATTTPSKPQPQGR